MCGALRDGMAARESDIRGRITVEQVLRTVESSIDFKAYCPRVSQYNFARWVSRKRLTLNVA